MSLHHCLMCAGLDCGTVSGQRHQQKELRVSLVQVGNELPHQHSCRSTHLWMLETACKNSKVSKIMTEPMEERGYENSVQQCNKVKTATHKGTTLYRTDKSSFGASCRIYQGCLFQLLSQLCSHCKRHTPSLDHLF